MLRNLAVLLDLTVESAALAKFKHDETLVLLLLLDAIDEGNYVWVSDLLHGNHLFLYGIPFRGIEEEPLDGDIGMGVLADHSTFVDLPKGPLSDQRVRVVKDGGAEPNPVRFHRRAG